MDNEKQIKQLVPQQAEKVSISQEEIEKIKNPVDEDSSVKVVDIDYPIVSVSRNIACRLFDFFIFLVLSLLFVGLAILLIQSSPSYKHNMDSAISIRLDSQLYIKNTEGEIVNIASFYSDSEKGGGQFTLEEKSKNIETHLHFFLDNENSPLHKDKNGNIERNNNISFESELKFVLLNYTDSNNEKIFDEQLKPLKYNSDTFNAYCDIVKNTVLGYLNLIPNYTHYQNSVLTMYIVWIIVTVILCYSIIYYVFPMIFSRGKKTPGMFITNTSLLSSDGFSCKWNRFTLRFLFKLFAILIGSFVAFLIPLAISITMIVVTKAHQSFSEYVSNTYLVYSADKSVYLSYAEMTSFDKKESKNMSILNKDLTLKP